jgi:hypothetical protein
MLHYHHQQAFHTSEHTTSVPPGFDQRISGEPTDNISRICDSQSTDLEGDPFCWRYKMCIINHQVPTILYRTRNEKMPDMSYQDTTYVGTHVGKMRTNELWHRRLMHMSYVKLKRGSTVSLPGMPSFKIHDYPCHTCMDTNAKRANRKPVSERDTCDAQFDLFDMSKCESIGGHRYCTVIVICKSRYVFIFLHKTKGEIQSVWTKCLNTLGDKYFNAVQYPSRSAPEWVVRKDH